MSVAQTPAKPTRSLLRRLGIALEIGVGLLIGYGLSLVLAFALVAVQVRSMMTTVNGWQSTKVCGVPGGLLVQAACGAHLPAINTAQEAVYWEATVDAQGARLDGAKRYRIHFPPGGLPPVSAFWSITLAGANRLMTANAAHKYSVSDRRGLQANPDGSVDVLLQPAAPSGRERNWLPTPNGNFMLWLRAYGPAPTVLDGSWHPPAVTEVQP
jgi:hypothetical protein